MSSNRPPFYSRVAAVLALFTSNLPGQTEGSLLPQGWDAKEAANRVLTGLVNTTAPQVKGAHDAEFVCVGDRAFIVAEANDEKAGESAAWPGIYVTLSIVNLKTLAVEKHIPVAKSAQAFENETLPAGACFVPRIIQKDARTARCYFASEQPTKRPAQIWFIDFELEQLAFQNRIFKARLKTAAGTFDMQPQVFYADAAAHGFQRPAMDYGLYLADGHTRRHGPQPQRADHVRAA